MASFATAGPTCPSTFAKNDYWPESEKQVCGEWIGQGATMLGLEGAVTGASFKSLRANKKTRMSLFDIQISAPKDVSVLAMVGGDERVREAFIESVQAVLVEMEHFAAVCERRGHACDTEAFRRLAYYGLEKPALALTQLPINFSQS